MARLEIEKSLQKVSDDEPYYSRYDILKNRLFKYEYEHWGQGWGQGNNHGPGHIKRVLENFDKLLGPKFLKYQIITPYELFLTMMSILYHDVGILRGRAEHAKMSGTFLGNESEIFFNARDVDIVKAAVVSHSSSNDIEDECRQFSDEEYIGSETVRPRVVAALVRIADELDEDYRRADPELQRKIGITPESEFYWEFCQRIRAVRPQRWRAEIRVDVKFDTADRLRKVLVAGKSRLFISAFAEKLAKINHERTVVNKYLPEHLRYKRIVVSVKPSADSSNPASSTESNPASPTEFIFNDETLASQLVKALPDELTVQPTNDKLSWVLNQIPRHKLKEAEKALQDLEEVLDDLPAPAHLRVLWTQAIICSLRAEELKGKRQGQLLNRGLQYLESWHKFGFNNAWRELGLTASNEIFRIAEVRELKFLYQQRRTEIEEILGPNRNYLEHFSSGFGAGGCVPAGTRIDTPEGIIMIENLRTGADIFSASLTAPQVKIQTKVIKIHKLRGEKCVRVNDEHVFTVSQPLYARNGSWILAGELSPGCELVTIEGSFYVVKSVSIVETDADVYTLTTNHPTHNFIVANLICRNKITAEDIPPKYNRWIL